MSGPISPSRASRFARSISQPRSSSLPVLIGLLVVAVVLGAVAIVVFTPSSSPAVPTLPVSLIAGPKIAVVPSTFWGLSTQTSQRDALATNPSLDAYLNATPFAWFRYGEGADACNASTDQAYDANGNVTGACAIDLTSFRAWCEARQPPCHAIVQLPGENNNSAEDAAIARHIVSTVGFQPDYWTIGNEPLAWTHYGEPWTSWRSTDNSTPTPIAYATDVRSAIASVRAVDPAAKFVGVEAADAGQASLLQAVVEVNGPNLGAIAYHSYPSTGATPQTLAEFFAPLYGSGNLTDSYPAARIHIVGACPSCATLPIFVNEYNAGPPTGSPYVTSYADAVFLAASLTQALRANVSQLTIFTLQGNQFGLLDSNGAMHPSGALFGGLLDHLAVGPVFADGLAPAAYGLFEVRTTNSTSESLLLVNANTSTAFSVNLSSVLAPSGPVDLWQSTSAQAGGVRTSPTGLATIIVPPLGVALINRFVGGAPFVAPSAAPEVLRLGPSDSFRPVEASPLGLQPQARVDDRGETLGRPGSPQPPGGWGRPNLNRSLLHPKQEGWSKLPHGPN